MHASLSPVKIWRRQKHVRNLLGKRGKIVTFTLIHVAGRDFMKEAPFPVVMVEFKGGKRAYGQLVDFRREHLTTGQEVVSVLRKVREPNSEGVIAYGLKFVPI